MKGQALLSLGKKGFACALARSEMWYKGLSLPSSHVKPSLDNYFNSITKEKFDLWIRISWDQCEPCGGWRNVVSYLKTGSLCKKWVGYYSDYKCKSPSEMDVERNKYPVSLNTFWHEGRLPEEGEYDQCFFDAIRVYVNTHGKNSNVYRELH